MPRLGAVGTGLLLAALAGLARAGAAAADDDAAVPLVLRLSDEANAIWSALPADADDPRVTRVGAAPAGCTTRALAESRRLLGQGEGARAALRHVSLDLPVPRTVADRLARGDVAPSLLAPWVTPATRGAQVAQPLGDASCGAYYDLHGAGEEPGRLVLALQIEAGCGCTEGLRLHLMARAPLTPGAMEKKDLLRLRAGEARYEVLASCEPCEPAAAPATAPRVSLPGGPCEELCAPLARGLAAWQHKIAEAAARLEGLAGKATTLELQVTSDRQELAAAGSAPSRPRAVLERISALQARIKAAQAELERVRQASQDVERALAGLRRVAGDTESAEGRCRAQCQARPPRRASAPESGGAARAGGISTGVLVAGGAALAVGGAVALAAGGSDAPGATGPPDFSGLWRGTKVVISELGSANPCRRVFDEGWRITQSGSSLEIAVDTLTTDCGPPACQGGCSAGDSLQRRHVGRVSGSSALVYPYLDYQTPSCTLPLTLQGTTLRGFMPACRTEQPLPVSMDVVLQRVTR